MTDADDVITLRGLSADGRHGVYPFEREGGQSFTVDLSLWVDTRAAAAGDDLELTVDYGQIAQEVVAVLEGPSVYLLETLAQRVADAALSHPRVRAVEVTLHKPMAPLRQQFSDVALTVHRTTASSAPALRPGHWGASEDRSASAAPEVHPVVPARVGRRSTRPSGTRRGEAGRHVVLALGGNLGDAPTTLARAVGQLMDVDGLEIDDVSPVVRTLPVLEPGQQPQPDYWNAVVLARTWLEPGALLEATSAVEQRLGRERHQHWGPRTVDIDIVQLQGVTSDDPALTLPHPRARSRAFVLVPWQLADPDAVLEGAGRVDLLARVAPDRDGVVDAVSDWLEEPESVADESDQVLSGRSAHPVMATPAGGSVVVDAAPPARTAMPPVQGRGRPSRLDRLPETSRTDLRPDGTGADYLWRKLWAQWESASLPEAGAAAGPADTAAPMTPHAPTAAPGDGAPDVPPASAVACPTAVSRVTTTVPTPEGVADRISSPRTARADPAEAAHWRRPAAAATDSERPAVPTAAASAPVHPSHAGEQAAPAPQDAGARRTPKWVPVRGGGAARPRPAAASEAAPPASAGHGSDTAGTPSLPAWNFPSRDNVRIVDDARDLAPAHSATSGPAAPPADDRAGGQDGTVGPDGGGAPHRRSILDPHLPPSTPTGPLDHDVPGQTTSIMRRVTVRPTVTGHQPVVGRGGAQP